jgi:hypothetical protein
MSVMTALAGAPLFTVMAMLEELEAAKLAAPL